MSEGSEDGDPMDDVEMIPIQDDASKEDSDSDDSSYSAESSDEDSEYSTNEEDHQNTGVDDSTDEEDHQNTGVDDHQSTGVDGTPGESTSMESVAAEFRRAEEIGRTAMERKHLPRDEIMTLPHDITSR